MKGVVLLQIFFCLFFVPFGSISAEINPAVERVVLHGQRTRALTRAQEEWVGKYTNMIVKAEFVLSLKPKATREEIRLALCKKLDLSKETDWEQIVSHPLVRLILTESRRDFLVETFELPKNATWLRIWDTLESTRAENRR